MTLKYWIMCQYCDELRSKLYHNPIELDGSLLRLSEKGNIKCVKLKSDTYIPMEVIHEAKKVFDRSGIDSITGDWYRGLWNNSSMPNLGIVRDILINIK